MTSVSRVKTVKIRKIRQGTDDGHSLNDVMLECEWEWDEIGMGFIGLMYGRPISD